MKSRKIAQYKPETFKGTVYVRVVNKHVYLTCENTEWALARVYTDVGTTDLPDGEYDCVADKSPQSIDKLGKNLRCETKGETLVIGAYTFKRAEYQRDEKRVGETTQIVIDGQSGDRCAYATDRTGNRPILSHVAYRNGFVFGADGYRLHRESYTGEFSGTIYAPFLMGERSIAGRAYQIERDEYVVLEWKKRYSQSDEAVWGWARRTMGVVAWQRYNWYFEVFQGLGKYPDTECLLPQSHIYQVTIDYRLEYWLQHMEKSFTSVTFHDNRVTVSDSLIECEWDDIPDVKTEYPGETDGNGVVTVEISYLLEVVRSGLRVMYFNTRANPVYFLSNETMAVIMPKVTR